MSLSTNAAKPIYGINAIVQVQPATGSNPDATKWITIKNSEYSITPKASIKEAPNTTDGMIRVSGLNDYDLDFSGSTDTSSETTPPEVNLMAGSQIFFQCFRNGVTNIQSAAVTGDYWGGRAIIESLKIDTGTDDTENWECSAMKQSGLLSLPAGGTW